MNLERYFIIIYYNKMDFQDKKNLFKVRKTVIEMIQDRGFSIPESENISFEVFMLKYENKNLDIFIENDDGKKIFVHFHNEVKNFSKSDLKNIMTKVMSLYNDPDISIILILREKENSAVSKELMKDTFKNVEIFLKKNMMFNITRHVYVPKHIILTPEEEKEVLEKYSTTKGKLPKMSKNDPVAKYYGMKTDQICKIIRRSPEVGESIYYRLVR
jgi:DNA-directed RNA polymerase I, II, and III subunit RPABC1